LKYFWYVQKVLLILYKIVCKCASIFDITRLLQSVSFDSELAHPLDVVVSFKFPSLEVFNDTFLYYNMELSCSFLLIADGLCM
jgi:hypothetical protein